jgi:hypothetical protein
MYIIFLKIVPFFLTCSVLSLPKRAQLYNAYNTVVVYFGLPLLLYSINSNHKGFRGLSGFSVLNRLKTYLLSPWIGHTTI